MTAQEFQSKYGRAPSAQPLSTQQTQTPQDQGTLGNVAQGITNFVGAKGIADEFGATIAHAFASPAAKPYVQFPSGKAVLGSAIQSGANLIPGLGEGNIIARTGAGLAAGYAMDTGSKLQNNDPAAGQPGVATAVGGALPLAGVVAKPATAFIGRLFKGLGSELSGVSSKTIGQILNNPKAAQKASDLIKKSGQSHLLEENAKAIVNGISGIKKEAGSTFGKAMEGLQKEDINPKSFRDSIQPVLDKFGSTLNPETNTRTLNNVEFDDPKNLNKAGELIDKLSNTELDGVSLRKLSDDIENSKYKTAMSDERRSFNAFAQELSGAVKGAISKSTSKLDDANKAYSHDMQLAQMAEGEFGKVKFRNLPELVKTSKQVDQLFQKGGIAPEKINDFLTRAGIDPTAFNSSEAMRQISNQEGGKNSVGTNFSEMLRGITSAVITPKMVGDVATLTGLGKEIVEPFLKGLKTPARNALLQALVQSEQEAQTNSQQ